MKCPNCNTPVGMPEWKARSYLVWRNAYGYCQRVFCGVCGQWTDITYKYGTSVELTTRTERVVKQPIQKVNQ